MDSNFIYVFYLLAMRNDAKLLTTSLMQVMRELKGEWGKRSSKRIRIKDVQRYKNGFRMLSSGSYCMAS